MWVLGLVVGLDVEYIFHSFQSVLLQKCFFETPEAHYRSMLTQTLQRFYNKALMVLIDI